MRRDATPALSRCTTGGAKRTIGDAATVSGRATGAGVAALSGWAAGVMAGADAALVSERATGADAGGAAPESGDVDTVCA
jgi:hypothetical protein